MKTIWKFPIRPDSVKDNVFKISIQVPFYSKPLCIMNQDRTICVWVEVDPKEEKKELLHLYCVGTGHGAVPEDKNYLGSVIDGAYVWHFYI
jgi:hypothetical protein